MGAPHLTSGFGKDPAFPKWDQEPGFSKKLNDTVSSVVDEIIGCACPILHCGLGETLVGEINTGSCR